jgi:hypothetical protein
MTEAAVAIPLHSRRRARARRLQHAQHAIPAAGLAVAGTQAILANAPDVIAALRDARQRLPADAVDATA